jgi:hypothetical protein
MQYDNERGERRPTKIPASGEDECEGDACRAGEGASQRKAAQRIFLFFICFCLL